MGACCGTPDDRKGGKLPTKSPRTMELNKKKKDKKVETAKKYDAFTKKIAMSLL